MTDWMILMGLMLTYLIGFVTGTALAYGLFQKEMEEESVRGDGDGWSGEIS